MSYNKYQASNTFLSVIFWLLLILLLSFGGLFLLDFVGVYSFRPYFLPYVQWTGLVKKEAFFSDNDPLLLEKERIEKRELAVKLHQQEILKCEVELARRKLELEEIANELAQQQKNQAERESQLLKQNQRYADETANLRQNAEYLLAMPPQAAVERLKGLDDAVLIVHLRMCEELSQKSGESSMVPVWLSLMPAEQAARIIKKMQLPSI